MCGLGVYCIEPTLHYETPVKLCGTIYTRTVFGPPNYGETPKTDRKCQILLLFLDHSISLKTDVSDKDTLDDTSFSNQWVVELVVNPHHLKEVKALLGRHVCAEGTLFQADNANHYTNVLLSVKKLSPK
jgi:hypothetical protein